MKFIILILSIIVGLTVIIMNWHLVIGDQSPRRGAIRIEIPTQTTTTPTGSLKQKPNPIEQITISVVTIGVLRPSIRPHTHDLVALGAGTYNGYKKSNTKHGLLHSYDQGFRIFEIDFVKTKSGDVIGFEKGQESEFGLDQPIENISTAHATQSISKKQGDPLTPDIVLAFLRAHPNTFVLLDGQENSLSILKEILANSLAREKPHVASQIIPQVSSQNEYDELLDFFHFSDMILDLTTTRLSDDSIINFVRKNTRISGVRMSADRYTSDLHNRLLVEDVAIFVDSVEHDDGIREFLSSRVGVLTGTFLKGPEHEQTN